LLTHGRWFSPGTPASSTTKTGPHDIAEILLNVPLNTKINQSNQSIDGDSYLFIDINDSERKLNKLVYSNKNRWKSGNYSMKFNMLILLSFIFFFQ
jgi:hypothetical protein